MSWSRKFEEPIALPGGKHLVTLRDAANYIVALPAAEQQRTHWQTAAAELLMSAERKGIIMLARIAMMQAINHGKKPDDPAPRKKAVKSYRIIR